MADKEKNVVLNFKMDGQIEYAKTIKDINAIMNAAASEYQTHVAAMGKDADATKKLGAEKKKLEIQLEAGRERTKKLRAEYEAMAKDTKTSTSELANKHKQLMNSERAEMSLEQALEKVNDSLSDQAIESRKAQEALDKLETEASQLESQTEKLNAKYELQKAQLGDNASEADKLSLQMEHLNKTHDIAKEKVENYEQQLEQAKKQYGENSSEVDKYEVQLLEARTAEQQLSNEIVSTNKQLKEQNDVLAKTGKQLQETGNKLKAVGKNLMMKVTAPLIGVAAAATKVGMDFEASVSEMGAISGAVGADLIELEDKAREMGATTNKSAKQAADAMGFMALAGWNNKQMLEGIEPVLKLSSAGNMDLARTSDLVTDSMAALQIEVKDLPSFLDMVAQASRKSNTNIDALMEAFLVAGGTLASFNVPLEESTALLGILANRGLKGSEAGTALNAIFTNLTSGAGQAGKAMKKLDISAFDSKGNFKGLEETLLEVKKKISGMTEEQQAQYVTMIAGKEHLKSFQSLMAGLGDEYGELKKDVSNATGVLDEMYKVMTDNLKGQWDEFKSAMDEAGISIFKNIQPALVSLLGYMQQGVDWFNNLSPTIQTTIVVLGVLAAAIGPLIVTIGMLVGSIGAIATAFSAVSAGVVLAAGGAVVAIVALGAAIAGIAYANSEALSKTKELSDGIKGLDKETKQSIDTIGEFSDKIDRDLTSAMVKGEKVTSDMASGITDQFSTMQKMITENNEKALNDRLTKMQQHSTESSHLTEEMLARIKTAEMNAHSESEERLIKQNNRVKEIVELAAKENRELTLSESQEIASIKESMSEKAIQSLSLSEEEQLEIYDRLRVRSGEISARQAAEIVQNAEKQRVETVLEAEKEYEERVANAEHAFKELGAISEAEYESLVAEAERLRDSKVSTANDMHTKTVEMAKEAAGEHVDLVNWETGEILSKWEVFKNNTSTKFSEIKQVLSDKWSEMREDTATKTKDLIVDAATKFHQLKTNTTTKLEETKRAVKEKFNDMVVSTTAKGAEIVIAARTKFQETYAVIQSKLIESVTEVSTQVGKMPGKVKEKIGEMKQAGVDLLLGFIDGMKSMATDAIEAITGVVDGVISKAKSLLKIASPSKVFVQIGKWVSEGWADGIESLGDSVVDAVESIALTSMDIAEHYAKEEIKLRNKANADIALIEKRAAEDVAKIQRAALSKKRKTTQDENIRIRRIQEDAAKKIKTIQTKATKEILGLETKMYKDILNEAKMYISDKKSLNQLSLKDEVYIWEQTLKLFDDGSKEKIYIQQEHKKAVEAVNKEITSINNQYLSEMQKINDELAKSEQKLTDEYNAAYSNRVNAIKNFAGIFDEFVVKTEKSGQDLLSNMQSQVVGLAEWRAQLESLWERVGDQALMEELEELGPKALGELRALNNLSDEELQQFVGLYNAKFELAREQATHELEGMKEDTEFQISEMRKVANKKLDELQTDWTKAIKKTTQATSDEFKSLSSIGKQAGQNLLDGLSSMEGALVSKAQSIATAVNSAMASALGNSQQVSPMSFDTKWNAKGGIFTQPTIFGASGGKLQGAGEAGPEAVLPLNDETLGAIGKGIAKTMGGSNITINSRDDAESIARAVERVQRRAAFRMG